MPRSLARRPLRHRSTIALVYAKHFDLKQEPFSIAPDPRYLYMSERHREALAHLLYGLRGSGGLVLLTGEIGAGKTTVCRCFLEQIPKKCNVAYIFNPKLTVPELLRTVCDEFHIPRDHINTATDSVKDYVDAINQFLLRTHAVGQNNVLIIDEAQNLSVDVLEQLRLLTNLETAERKLLQIILIGQPELRDMLAQPQLEQLAQRVTARYHLEALDEEETTLYMRHRLSVAGRKSTMPFEREARKRIHTISRGVPRRINLLCDRAMLGAYAAGAQRITAAMINQSAEEVFGPALRQPSAALALSKAPWMQHAPWIGAGVLGGGLLVALALWVSNKPPASGGATQNLEPRRAAVETPVKPAVAPAAASEQAAASAAQGASAMPSAIPIKPVTREAAPASQLAPSPNKPIASTKTLKPLRNEQQAWRLLALTSKITLAEGDPCQAAGLQKLQCAKHSGGDLTILKQLRQPALLTLRNDQGTPSYVVFTGSADDASLALRGEGGSIIKMEAPLLATQWRGEFATFKPLTVATRLTNNPEQP